MRIFDPPVEGKLVDGLDDFAIGDLVRIKLVYTHVQLGFVDFASVDS